MSQQMNILCCCSCSMYQVHIVKKAKKWQCKICNTKQTFRRIFFQGSGKDCRIQVQKLNAMKEYEDQSYPSFDMASNTCGLQQQDDYTDEPRLKALENKWTKYLDTSDEGLLNAVQTSDYQEVNKTTDDSLELSNDNASYECPQNSNSFYYNDSQQNASCNDEEESDNLVKQKIYYIASDTKNDSESDNSRDKNLVKTEDATNIFDDNEDFDLAIDF